MNSEITVNFHLTKNCNFRCGFCFAHFKQSSHLEIEKTASIVREIKKSGFRKINFAGGEPLLYKNFESLLLVSKEIGLITSMISNGSRITKSWVNNNAHNLDILGISCDSAKPETLRQIGRGDGSSIDHTKKIFSWITDYNEKSGRRVFKKLNSVVSKFNWNENMSEYVASLNIDRWKVFQVLKIEGENDHKFSEFETDENEFNFFLKNHKELAKFGLKIVPENNSAMTNSYLMVNPDGCFYYNHNGKYLLSDPILDVGIETALKQIHFSKDKFKKREGFYII
ncbi:viperin family antiviral radical SAM protein [Leptospira kanakyensis]|uniref:viperin family antiviral radical SAM protein n=1 Tax=Leptospira kanakyensis TaxID=2484968 RepID=UPI00223E09EE|nr:viperin family antiviral radical SAM protein [Leptospira kanakyensis]MCW7471252.1 viperin family antiviral radical SAM protein [Leptospira kanakyensis]MCW7481987.1 viperin family antiviral radical SAM protein [Leptospira kanakyensis]